MPVCKKKDFVLSYSIHPRNQVGQPFTTAFLWITISSIGITLDIMHILLYLCFFIGKNKGNNTYLK